MTTWSPHRVAAIAVKGGFTAAQVPMATAVAWSTTGGADHYERTESFTDELHERGLWGLRRLHTDDDEWSQLFDPVASATVAARLVKAHEGSWLWHQVAYSPGFTDALDFVTQALRTKGVWESAHMGLDTAGAFRQAAATAVALRDATIR